MNTTATTTEPAPTQTPTPTATRTPTVPMHAVGDTLAADPGYRHITWTAFYVPPGTPYEDEPTVDVPPGWYVVGDAAEVDDDGSFTRYRLVIQQAWDDDLTDVGEHLAHHIAATLNVAQGVS